MTEKILLERENKLLKTQQVESIRLFKELQKQVGTQLGERISEHIAQLQGQRHNPAEWNMADLNGEQGR